MDESKTPQQVGRYEIKSELGRGGMSTVYLAYDPNVDRTVAVKLLPREFLHHKEFRARFNREARIIAALEHSAIVPIYDFGEAEGQPYFVMRHMSGGSLADALDKGPVTVEEASKIIERIGSALQYAHSKGVVHRDLKPGNILFDQFGTAYLADFGIARLEETGATLTGSVFMGTPAYMSPEQVQAVHDLDGRADIYALGVILYEMLTGIKPFSAKTAAATALKHVTEPVPHILVANPNLPPDMEQVINKAMAKDPDERYLLATDLTEDVTTLAAGKTIIGGKPPTVDDGDPEATMIAPAAGAAAVAAAAASSVMDTAIVTPAEQAAVAKPPTTPPATGSAAPADTTGAAAAAAATTGAAAASSSAAAAGKPATQPPVEAVEEGGRSRLLIVALVALLAIVCLAAVAAGVYFAGESDGLGGLFSSETETPTQTPSSTNTATTTQTATATSTSTSTPTETPTDTPEPTSTNTPVSQPTLRPTNTIEPTTTALPTFTRRPPTSTPVPIPPTSPPQPTSPPPQPTSPPPQPTSPPPQPTAPPSQPTAPSDELPIPG